MDNDIERFKQLCFLFVCEKLDQESMAWMRAMLRTHGQLQADVDAERELAARARAGLDALYQATAPLVSFDSVMAAVNSRTPSTHDRLLHWLQRCWKAQLPVVWVAGATAMLAIAVGVNQYADDAGLRSYRGGGQVKPAGPQLIVVFADQLTIGELRALLAANELTLVRGPDAQGVARLAVDEGSAAAALAALRANSGVIDARIAGETR